MYILQPAEEQERGQTEAEPARQRTSGEAALSVWRLKKKERRLLKDVEKKKGSSCCFFYFLFNYKHSTDRTLSLSDPSVALWISLKALISNRTTHWTCNFLISALAHPLSFLLNPLFNNCPLIFFHPHPTHPDLQERWMHMRSPYISDWLTYSIHVNKSSPAPRVFESSWIISHLRKQLASVVMAQQAFSCLDWYSKKIWDEAKCG